MSIKKKAKGALSGTFNVLTGKKGWRATVAGYAAGVDGALVVVAAGVLVAGTAGIALPAALGGVWLAAAALNANSARRFAKQHDQKKGPAL